MSETTCPACKSENEDDALFCDQCGQPLPSHAAANPKPAEPGDADACPACGGEVEDLSDGSGRCRACGLELVATPDEEDAGADRSVARALSTAIIANVRRGQELEHAVADACRKILDSLGAEPERAHESDASAAPTAPLGRACPVCGADCAGGAERCPECAVWFSARHRPGPCPSCGESADGAKCRCGALLTSPAIAAALEPSVRFLCAKCKTPFVSRPEECPDCGGSLISADRLRASL